jgi:hypothetical protein
MISQAEAVLVFCLSLVEIHTVLQIKKLFFPPDG